MSKIPSHTQSRDSLDSTTPLLPSPNEKPPHQSSRARGAEIFRATPDGAFVTSKRDGFKRLVLHPRKFLGEAMGAGYEEMAQKKIEKEGEWDLGGWRDARDRRRRTRHRRRKSVRSSSREPPEVALGRVLDVTSRSPPVLMSGLAVVSPPLRPLPEIHGRQEEEIRLNLSNVSPRKADIEQASGGVARVSQHRRLPPPPACQTSVSEENYVVNPKSSRTPSATSIQAQIPKSMLQPAPPRSAPEGFFVGPKQPSYVQKPKSVRPAPSRSTPQGPRKHKPVNKQLPTSLSQTHPTLEHYPTLITPQNSTNSQRTPSQPKSAMRSKVLRPKRSVTFQDVLEEVCTFNKDDTPSSIPRVPSYDADR